MDHNCRTLVDHVIRALFVLEPADGASRMTVVTRFLSEQVSAEEKLQAGSNNLPSRGSKRGGNLDCMPSFSLLSTALIEQTPVVRYGNALPNWIRQLKDFRASNPKLSMLLTSPCSSVLWCVPL